MVLGFYEGFPRNVHQMEQFAASVSSKRLQQALLQIICRLNSKPVDLEEMASPSIPRCTAIFEFGIGDANSFTYLDDDETQRALKAAYKSPFRILDFFCLIRYYKMQGERRAPLRFDYYMLRFSFDRETVTVQVFHERGPMHVSPQEFAEFIVSRVNSFSSKKMLSVWTR